MTNIMAEALKQVDEQGKVPPLARRSESGKRLAVVVPSVRDECLQRFEEAWREQFERHDVLLVVVRDGDTPKLETEGQTWSVEQVMDAPRELRGGCQASHLIYNLNDGVRNLGFAYIARFRHDVETIITLDDDVLPHGDTLGDHLQVLEQRVPISWLSTASEFMRGFPYAVRDEAPVMVSHGIWHGVKDFDAPTQLVRGNPEDPSITFFKGPIPRGVLAPVCGMNLAFRREVLEHLYFAPMGHRVGLDRFADIWMGICLKRALDEAGQALVSGYASVWHERASNVLTNLEKEAKGLRLNEGFWRGDDSGNKYFEIYAEARQQWGEWVKRWQ